MNKLGFGLLRLPNNPEPGADSSVYIDQVIELVDCFMSHGGRYFDTAYTYLDGMSEQALREALVDRYPREQYHLITKLPTRIVKNMEDCERCFQDQLERCGVAYFDTYMIHWINADFYRKAEEYGEFEFLKKVKADGRAKAIGFSYHDTAEVLDLILTEHPETDCIMLQINYLDWENSGVQARLCYEVAEKHGVDVVVMEPTKGGSLAKIPAEAESLLKQIQPNASNAFQAMRFVMSLPNVKAVFSGMDTIEQILDNSQDTTPMTEQDFAVLQQAAEIIRGETAIACTTCGYCLKGCAQNICIPEYFKLYNDYARSKDDLWRLRPAYNAFASKYGKASECIQCGLCEESCPQKLPVSQLIGEVAEVFEPKPVEEKPAEEKVSE